MIASKGELSNDDMKYDLDGQVAPLGGLWHL